MSWRPNSTWLVMLEFKRITLQKKILMRDLITLRILTISLILIPLTCSELHGQLMRFDGTAWKFDSSGEQGLRCEMLLPDSVEKDLRNAEKQAIRFAVDLLGPPAIIRVDDTISIYWSRGSCLTNQMTLGPIKRPVLCFGYFIPGYHYFSLVFDVDGSYIVSTKIVKSG